MASLRAIALGIFFVSVQVGSIGTSSPLYADSHRGAARVCVIVAPDVADPKALALTYTQTLRIEARKSGRALEVRASEGAARCEESTVLDGETSEGWTPHVLAHLGHGLREARLSSMAGEMSARPSESLLSERAATLAYETLQIVASVESASTDAPAPLAEAGVERKTTGPSGRIPVGLGGAVFAGGRLGGEQESGSLVAGVELEAQLTMLDERLALGVIGAWEPARAIRTDDPRVDRSAGELGMVIRGGYGVDFWKVRGGLGGGVQWRTLRASANDGVEPGQSDLDDRTGFGQFDLEALFDVHAGIRVSALGWARVFSGGVDLRWAGESVYRSPRASYGGSVRMGYVF